MHTGSCVRIYPHSTQYIILLGIIGEKFLLQHNYSIKKLNVRTKRFYIYLKMEQSINWLETSAIYIGTYVGNVIFIPILLCKNKYSKNLYHIYMCIE